MPVGRRVPPGWTRGPQWTEAPAEPQAALKTAGWTLPLPAHHGQGASWDDAVHIGSVKKVDVTKGFSVVVCAGPGFERDVYVRKQVASPELLGTEDIVAFKLQPGVRGFPQASAPLWKLAGPRGGQARPSQLGEYQGQLYSVLPSGCGFVRRALSNTEVGALHGLDAYIHAKVMVLCELALGDLLRFNLHMGPSGKPQVSPPVWKCCSEAAEVPLGGDILHPLESSGGPSIPSLGSPRALGEQSWRPSWPAEGLRPAESLPPNWEGGLPPGWSPPAKDEGVPKEPLPKQLDSWNAEEPEEVAPSGAVYMGTVKSTDTARGFSMVDCPDSGFEVDVFVHCSVSDPSAICTGDIVAFQIGANAAGLPQACPPLWKLVGWNGKDTPRLGEYVGHVRRILPNGSGYVDCPEVAEAYGGETFVRDTVMVACGLAPGDTVAFNVHITAAGKPQMPAPCWKCCSVEAVEEAAEPPVAPEELRPLPVGPVKPGSASQRLAIAVQPEPDGEEELQEQQEQQEEQQQQEQLLLQEQQLLQQQQEEVAAQEAAIAREVAARAAAAREAAARDAVSRNAAVREASKTSWAKSEEAARPKSLIARPKEAVAKAVAAATASSAKEPATKEFLAEEPIAEAPAAAAEPAVEEAATTETATKEKQQEAAAEEAATKEAATTEAASKEPNSQSQDLPPEKATANESTLTQPALREAGQREDCPASTPAASVPVRRAQPPGMPPGMGAPWPKAAQASKAVVKAAGVAEEVEAAANETASPEKTAGASTALKETVAREGSQEATDATATQEAEVSKAETAIIKESDFASGPQSTPAEEAAGEQKKALVEPSEAKTSERDNEDKGPLEGRKDKDAAKEPDPQAHVVEAAVAAAATAKVETPQPAALRREADREGSSAPEEKKQRTAPAEEAPFERPEPQLDGLRELHIATVKIADEVGGFSKLTCPASGFDGEVHVHSSVVDPEVLARDDVVACKVRADAGGTPQATAPFWKLMGWDGQVAPAAFGAHHGRVSAAPGGRGGRVARGSDAIAVPEATMSLCVLTPGDTIAYDLANEVSGELEVALPLWRHCMTLDIPYFELPAPGATAANETNGDQPRKRPLPEPRRGVEVEPGAEQPEGKRARANAPAAR